jgi:uncharacterized protein YacL
MISTFPGSAWVLSKEQFGGTGNMLAVVVPIVVMLVIVVITFLYMESQQKREKSNVDVSLATSGMIALVVFWFVGVGVQSITTKVQDESPRIGYVYTYYAIGATVVGLLISLSILYFGSSLRMKASTVVIAIILTVVATCQLTVNWRLMDKMYAALEPNRALLVAFSSQAPIPHRCRALLDWTNGGWPDYYEEGMIQGLQAASRHYHHEEFCPGFVRPMP